jgi:multidrug resistance efflux pump
MELLLVLTYTAIVIVVFKTFKIPLTKWTVPTAALGGIFLLSSLVGFMNYNHPYAEICRSYFATTPLVPRVKGIVIEVLAKPNQPVDKGAVLFRIDPTPFQNKVKSLTAQLKAVNTHYHRTVVLLKKNVGSQRDVDNALAKRDSLKEELHQAEFDLKSTTIRAPTNGFVTHLILRPGMLATPLPLRPVMIFVHDENLHYVAWFRQNSLLRLHVGDKAEIAFDGIPGKVFQAKVQLVFPAIGEGQLQPTGDMMTISKHSYPGRVPVVLVINDPAFSQYKDKVPGGAYAQAAIYTKHAHHLAVMRKILLRMASWLNFLFPFH